LTLLRSGNADGTGTETENGEKDGEEGLREENRIIWTRRTTIRAGAEGEEDTVIK
jgi:hypothetical protein